MDIQKILIWNARGLNQTDCRNSVRDVILSTNADIVCLQETKIEVMTSGCFSQWLGRIMTNLLNCQLTVLRVVC